MSAQTSLHSPEIALTADEWSVLRRGSGERVRRLLAERERAARAEALDVAALLLGKVADYWDGRPTQGHGHHIYADLCDVLRGIRADADHNRTRPGEHRQDGTS